MHINWEITYVGTIDDKNTMIVDYKVDENGKEVKVQRQIFVAPDDNVAAVIASSAPYDMIKKQLEILTGPKTGTIVHGEEAVQGELLFGNEVASDNQGELLLG